LRITAPLSQCEPILVLLASLVPFFYLSSNPCLRGVAIAAKQGVMTRANSSAKAATTPHPDGRRERSRSSRSKIVAAMIEVVGKGDYMPSAARVAEVAGVGLRSVFRHFEDMDALFGEMNEIIEAKVLPVVLQVPQGETWQDKLVDIAERRAKVFETIMPYRVAGELKRFQSTYLMQNQRRLLLLEGETVDAHLPPELAANPEFSRAIKVILSFQTWRLLRHDMQLPLDEARAVVRRMLDDSLAGIGAG